MSDSKKDLTRIEDLSEYLHQLDDDKDYLPELPAEAEPPAFMEETLISEDSFSHHEEEKEGFESELSEFSSGDSEFANFEESESIIDFSADNNTDEYDFPNESNFDSASEFSSSEFESDGDFVLSEADPQDESAVDETVDSTAEDANSSDEFTPLFDDELPTLEKTPLPPPAQVSSFTPPETFSDLKQFSQDSSFTGMASEGNPSFSVLLKEIKYLEDAQDILTLLKELGLAMDSDDILMNRLTRGEFLIPRISEFAATILAHKLRRFDIDILVGLSDEIHPPKHSEEPEIGLVSKLTLYQNKGHHFQFSESSLDISQIIISATPTLDGYQVIKYLGVASEHKILEGHLVEDENSLEISSHYHDLAQKLKAHALKSHANGVVGLNYQLTPLPSNYGTTHTRYRLTCTGNLVWINRI